MVPDGMPAWVDGTGPETLRMYVALPPEIWISASPADPRMVPVFLVGAQTTVNWLGSVS
ncbi:MAG: hypothetical protein IPH16_05800 [Haliscomenobacter sp.]|nr:hypothetical protein [Haliscomenobacter sp.]